MIFQRFLSISSNYFKVERNMVHLEYPEHTHRCFEYFCQLKGKTRVTIDKKKYILNEGEAILVFPFQVHSYEALEDGNCEYCIFSPDMVQDFFQSYNGLVPENNKLTFVIPADIDGSNIYLCKAWTYLICGEFEKKPRKKMESSAADDNILISLLLYVENNYCGKCTLNDVAEKLGYDYSYVSKQFKNKIGTSFNKYVNMLRIRKSQHLIKNSNMNFSEIMLQCGFTSLRSFDRNFMTVVKMSPSEYKKSDIEMDAFSDDEE